jgi:hypothetical protein
VKEIEKDSSEMKQYLVCTLRGWEVKNELLPNQCYYDIEGDEIVGNMKEAAPGIYTQHKENQRRKDEASRKYWDTWQKLND